MVELVTPSVELLLSISIESNEVREPMQYKLEVMGGMVSKQYALSIILH